MFEAVFQNGLFQYNQFRLRWSLVDDKTGWAFQRSGSTRGTMEESGSCRVLIRLLPRRGCKERFDTRETAPPAMRACKKRLFFISGKI